MVIVRNIVKENYFRDSIQLMQLSEEAKRLPGVIDVALVMGTETNKEILERLGLLTEEGYRATKNDLVIAIKVETEEQLNSSLASIENMLTRTSISAAPTITERIFYSVDSAVESNPDINLALISIPGEYVRDVAIRLLEKGIHLHIFSDHVPVEHELELKKIASSKGLLVLGPGAGTSIINGKAIAFANSIRRGKIGIVAAAGTGLQEVSVLLDRVGLGISQGLGIGGNDVKESIGGIMAVDCIKALENDEETELIIVVSKPPDPPVVKKIIKVIEESKKKFILCFLGSQVYKVPKKLVKRVYSCRSLHSAVLRAASIVNAEKYKEAEARISMKLSEIKKQVKDLSKSLRPEQKYIRALYTGGTLMYESLLIYRELLKDVYSNAPLDPKYKLTDSFKSYKHTVVDLGEEEFTAGRAHPMIDPTIRKLRLIEEARDPEVAVITMDFMLGYGSHPDPVEAMTSSILEANKIAAEDGRQIVFMAHVCGTESDPQNALKQEEKLKKIGVVTFPSNALMAFASALLVKRGKISPEKVKKVYKMFLEK
ncbi:MAG: hypothetical protein LZ168_04375 [Thaumarchaeota archaeon]|nr:hypothetical protein [Candidatus Geocrenenecus arthurdayi]